MKTYRAYTDQDDAGPALAILVYEEERPPYKLRQMIVHSPSGLSWGFGGSGPADLALAILADYLGEAGAIPTHARYDHAIAMEIQHTRAWALHQDFKWQFIVPLDQGAGWAISGEEIAAWLAPRLPEIERAHQERRALALIGHRVELDDGRMADVMDLEGDGEEGDGQELCLVISPVTQGVWFRVAPTCVVRDVGPLPDDET